jgi:hypothetical protein
VYSVVTGGDWLAGWVSKPSLLGNDPDRLQTCELARSPPPFLLLPETHQYIFVTCIVL